ncbi:PPE domain-containing protein [Saccharopolyspora sp. TS4A08]|uniref:PPE domain-containing protein n=1 Tax=Saccharopolyspora ipomoeae TaxID=3042027 RepID=A0ABT6PPV6_9PSEU|nr:PPE domain-containing protein [Saccharopolyspora sp. TS4A08]MDI2030049.1 PPE domain-containing protein [Saccharopolyspora sp. TS4A08]
MGLLDTLDNAGAHVFGWEGAAEEKRNEQAAEAQRIAQQQQNRLASQNSGLEVGSYDSPGISQCVNWGGFSHADIYKTNQESIKPDNVGEAAETWINLAKALRERGESYHRDLANIVQGGWQGEAADKASEVGKPASDWMKASADAFEMTGNNLQAAGDAAGQSKQLVPQPEGFSWGEAAASAIPFGLSGGGVNALSQMEEQEQAEKAAQETMGRVYSPTLTQVDAKMPQYTAPDGSTANPPPVPPPGGTDWGGGMGNGGNVPGGSGAGSGGGYSGGVPGGAGSGIPGGGYSGGAYPGGTSPAGTGTAWANPPGGGLPGGGLPGGGAPGGGVPGGGGMGLAAGLGAGAGMGAGGKAGAGGLGAGAGGRGAGMGAGGRAGAGGLGGGAGAGAGAAGAGGRGAAGRGGMGGMGAGAGRRGEGSEDDEHERPSWLEEQDDVWMNDMPKTAPPVLGE